MTNSPALQEFSSTHRAGSVLVGDQARTDEAALVDLAITFGIIGAEFLAAVVEFLRVHRSNLETTAARQEQVASATRRADETYLACDCAAADRGFTL
ncbi:type VII secretion target [Gordonia alkanivorans]|uniref:type VII secretion target n=1 Tax=Gordonia alkanivorans TaxID=84096 RepID=UPI00244891EE|nr:ESX-1 secretion-associated protein [Gordonia alkanivorans]MDH3047421.1 ESX-1 secretion-associated protein [Gordonia alkanivorans]